MTFQTFQADHQSELIVLIGHQSVPAGKISHVCWSTKISSCVVCNFVEHFLKVKIVGYKYVGY